MCVIILQLFIIYLATNRGAGDVSRNTTCFSHMGTAWNSKKYCTFWYAKNGAIRAQKGVLDLGENRSWKRKWSGLGRRIRKGYKVLRVTLQTHTPERRRSLGDGFRDSLSLLAERPQCFHWLPNCPLWLEHIGALGLWKSVSVRDSIGPQKPWLFSWPALVTW